MKTVITAAAVLAGAGVANAAIALATVGNTMYRVDLDAADPMASLETFTLSDEIISQATLSDGRTLAFSNSAVAGTSPQEFEVYELTDPLGANPTLTEIGRRSSSATTHTEIAPGEIRALNNGSLLSADPNNNFELTAIANTGISGTGSSAWDGSNFYALSGDDNLYVIDLANPTAPSIVGNTGVDIVNQGMEFFEGELFAAIQDSSNDLSIGTIDTATGAFSPVITIATGGRAATSINILPTPGAVAIFGVAGLSAVRRRR